MKYSEVVILDLFEEFNIKNTLPLKPLKNVAKQTRTILKEELRNAQILG